MSLKRKTIKGVIWNLIGRISNQVLQFGLSVLLMRLLDPRDYGTLAMAMVLIGFVGIFTEFGFGSALVQKQHIDEQHQSSIFWVNVGIGIILTAIFFGAAPWIADFYHLPSLTRVVQFLSFSFLLGALGIVPGAILQRNMKFAVINKISVGSTAFSGLVAVVLALRGAGVMSLVAQNLAAQLFTLPFVFLAARWRPRLLWSTSHVKDLFSFSAYLTGFNTLNYWARRADDLLVGKYMGADALGIYSRAYNLMLLPISQVISLVSNVMFPALASIQHDRQRVKRIFIQVEQTIALISFPMMLGLVAAADHFIIGIFGQKWEAAVPIIRILAFVGLLQSIGNPSGWIYMSQGRTSWMFGWGLFASPCIVAAIVIGILMGSIQAVAIAYLMVNVLLAYPVLHVPGRLIGMQAWEVYKAVLPQFLLAAVMATGVYALNLVLPAQLSHLAILAIQVIVGICLYGGLVWAFKISAFMQLKQLVKEQVREYRKKKQDTIQNTYA